MQNGRASSPARGQTRSHFLEEQLAEEIIDGRLFPGTRQEEQALANRFKTSRTPVREALRRLAAMGLIEISPRRDVVVSTVTRIRLSQMFETKAERRVRAPDLPANAIIHLPVFCAY